MAMPHIASSQKSEYSKVTRKEYKIASVEQPSISEILYIDDIVKYFKNKGLDVYYLHKFSEFDHAKQDMVTINQLIPYGGQSDITFLFLYDQDDVTSRMQQEHYDFFLSLPQLYLLNGALYVKPEKRTGILKKDYKWTGIVKKLKTLAELENYTSPHPEIAPSV